MRIVATSDTHYKVDVKKWIPDGDVFIHAGDLMRTGYPSDFEEQLEWLAELPHQVKILVPGNHDFHLQVYPGPALQQLRSVGVWVIGLPGNDHFNFLTLSNGVTICGLPYVKNLPRWAFNAKAHELRAVVDKTAQHDIIVSHSPVRGFLDEVPSGDHVGIEEYRRLLEARPPKYWINGHIHEAYGTTTYKDTTFYNVAMCDRSYTHANPPVVFDI